MTKFNSKSFNPQAFGAYVERIPNVTRSELARSGAVGANENARVALSGQTGSVYARVPYFGRISAATSQNNDGSSDISATTTTTFEQGFVVASRMDSWTERSFSKNITAGADFMDSVAAQIADYKAEVKQGILLKMLKGIFSMNTVGNTLEAKSAKAFVENHTYDVTGTQTGLVEATTLNSAIQQACGDNMDAFKLVLMHSVVATNLENLNLMRFLQYTDNDGITRDLNIGTWNSRVVLIDDGMPVENVEAEYALTSDESIDSSKTYYTRSGSGTAESPYVYTAVASPDVTDIATYYEMTAAAYKAYTTYVLGEGAVILDNIGDFVPYEMSRNPAKNGGEDTLFVRDRYICGVEGISFEKPVSLTVSAANSDLADGGNWCVINDGVDAIEDKSIAIARIISKG